VSSQRLFYCERVGDVLVVTPLTDIGGVESEVIQADVAEIVVALAQIEPPHIVFDFKSVAYFGSAMLEAMLTVWREARGRGGRLAVCNLSEAERELLATVRFDSLWPIGATRDDALALVRRHG
jgi:anti-anti-sigma factor